MPLDPRYFDTSLLPSIHSNSTVAASVSFLELGKIFRVMSNDRFITVNHQVKGFCRRSVPENNAYELFAYLVNN